MLAVLFRNFGGEIIYDRKAHEIFLPDNIDYEPNAVGQIFSMIVSAIGSSGSKAVKRQQPYSTPYTDTIFCDSPRCIKGKKRELTPAVVLQLADYKY